MFQKSKTKMQPFNYQWQLFFEQDFKLILPSSISLMLFIDKSVIGDNYNQYPNVNQERVNCVRVIFYAPLSIYEFIPLCVFKIS